MRTADDPEPLRRALRLGLDHRYAEAIEVLREFLGNHPDNSLGWRRLAGAYLGTNQLTEARRAAERAVATAPADPVSHRMLGVALLHSGEYAQAADAADEAIARDGTDAESHALLAYALLELPDGWARARSAATRAHRLDPHNAAATDVYRRVQRLRRRGVAVLAYAAGAAVAFVLLAVAGIVALGGSIPGIWYLLGPAIGCALLAGAAVYSLRQVDEPADEGVRVTVPPDARPGALSIGLAAGVAGLTAFFAAAGAGAERPTQLGIGGLVVILAVVICGSTARRGTEQPEES